MKLKHMAIVISLLMCFYMTVGMVAAKENTTSATIDNVIEADIEQGFPGAVLLVTKDAFF